MSQSPCTYHKMILQNFKQCYQQGNQNIALTKTNANISNLTVPLIIENNKISDWSINWSVLSFLQK